MGKVTTPHPQTEDESAILFLSDAADCGLDLVTHRYTATMTYQQFLALLETVQSHPLWRPTNLPVWDEITSAPFLEDGTQ